MWVSRDAIEAAKPVEPDRESCDDFLDTPDSCHTPTVQVLRDTPVRLEPSETSAEVALAPRGLLIRALVVERQGGFVPVDFRWDDIAAPPGKRFWLPLAVLRDAYGCETLPGGQRELPRTRDMSQ